MSISVIITSALIFIARLLDVSIGTLRIVSVAKGRKYLAPLLAFVEITIWLIAIRQIMLNLSNVHFFVAYAAGYALGNFIGIKIEERLALGKVIIRIITKSDATRLVESMRQAGFGVTIVPAVGRDSTVQVIFSIVRKKDLKPIINMIRTFNPKAFYSIEEVHTANEGIFPRCSRPLSPSWLGTFKEEKQG